MTILDYDLYHISQSYLPLLVKNNGYQSIRDFFKKKKYACYGDNLDDNKF